METLSVIRVLSVSLGPSFKAVGHPGVGLPLSGEEINICLGRTVPPDFIRPLTQVDYCFCGFSPKPQPGSVSPTDIHTKKKAPKQVRNIQLLN